MGYKVREGEARKMGQWIKAPVLESANMRVSGTTQWIENRLQKVAV